MGGWALLCVVSGWPCVPPAVLRAPGEQGLSAELTGPTPWQWKRSGQPGSWDGAPGARHPHCMLLSRWTGILWAARGEGWASGALLVGWREEAQRRTDATTPMGLTFSAPS